MLQHPLAAFGETAKKPCYFPRHPEPQAAKHKQAKLILRAFIVRTRCGGIYAMFFKWVAVSAEGKRQAL